MKLFKLFLIALTAFAVSCGDSVRNDNGVSFTFFGWFADVDGETGATSARYALNGAGVNNNSVVLFGGIQNNLTGQFIRVERAFHSYTVPGSSIRIPTTSVGVASFARPANPVQPGAGGGNAGGGNAGGGAAASQQQVNSSTLPQNALTDAGASYAGTNLMPASVGQYISLNRNQLPQTPFQMIVTTYYEGVTSAGRRIQSNPIQFEIEVVSDLNIGGGVDDEDEDLVDEEPADDEEADA